MSQRKEHFYNVCASLTYELEGQMISVLQSAPVSLPIKAVTSSALNQATRVMLSQLCQRRNVDPTTVREVAVVSVSYLGLLSPNDFYDLAPKPADQTEH